MRISADLTDAAILHEIGTRLARQRIECGLTQSALAEQAGVSKRTLERIEAGAGCELSTIVRLLRTLRLADGLEALVTERPHSPMALLKQHGRQRQRAPRRRGEMPSAASAADALHKPWTWRD